MNIGWVGLLNTLVFGDGKAEMTKIARDSRASEPRLAGKPGCKDCVLSKHRHDFARLYVTVEACRHGI